MQDSANPVLQVHTAKRDQNLSLGSVMEGTFVRIMQQYQIQQGPAVGKILMQYLTQVLALPDTLVQLEQHTQYHVHLVNTNRMKVNLLAKHAHLVNIVEQLASLNQVDIVVMDTSASVVLNSPNHMISCREDCVRKVIVVQAVWKLYVLVARMLL